jgi:hypothetical protein
MGLRLGAKALTVNLPQRYLQVCHLVTELGMRSDSLSQDVGCGGQRGGCLSLVSVFIHPVRDTAPLRVCSSSFMHVARNKRAWGLL